MLSISSSRIALPVDPPPTSCESSPKCHSPIDSYTGRCRTHCSWPPPSTHSSRILNTHYTVLHFPYSIELTTFQPTSVLLSRLVVCLYHTLQYKLQGQECLPILFVNVSQVPRNMPGIKKILNKYLSN